MEKVTKGRKDLTYDSLVTEIVVGPRCPVSSGRNHFDSGKSGVHAFQARNV